MKFETIPKFEQFTKFLEEQVEKGTFKVGTRLPSERDFARKYQLSHMTVNKALASLVGKKLLKRDYGNGTYVVGREELLSFRTVGVIIDANIHSHAPFPTILPSLLQKKGYFPMVLNVSSSNLKEQLRTLFDEKPKALIVDGYPLFPFGVLKNLPRETKLIFIHRFEGPRKYKASYILADYRTGGYLSTNHLIKVGRKKILILSFQIQPGWTSDLFYQGCERAFREAGLKPFSCIDTENAPEKIYEQIFSSKDYPDGILSFGDSRILPVLKILKKLFLKVPDNVEIIGYHNTPWAQAYQLTSISLQEKIMVEKVDEVLESSVKKEILIEPKLIFRNSCPERRIED